MNDKLKVSAYNIVNYAGKIVEAVHNNELVEINKQSIYLQGELEYFRELLRGELK